MDTMDENEESRPRPLAALRQHALRDALAREMHARPHGALGAPARVSQIAALSGEGGAEADLGHVAALCQQVGTRPPSAGAKHFSGHLGSFHLTWERHTEFSTYTFAEEGPLDHPLAKDRPFSHPFAGTAMRLVPRAWLEAMPGEVVAATHVALEPVAAPVRTVDDLMALFGGNTPTGSRMMGGRAMAWTDHAVHGDGFGRILVRDGGLNRQEVGRLIQRLLEIECYRMMAMLAFPLAREAAPRIATAEREVSAIMARLPGIEGVEDERRLLGELSRLAAAVEAEVAATGYRFSAAAAYYGLVTRRIRELREERIEGLQPPGQFLERRLEPAMETCRSVARRQETLARRIANASELLRTRVEIALEGQNHDLLKSMDRRARLQLRLQQVVEGLSVVAISYYAVGLVQYAARGMKAAGIAIDVDKAGALALPIVVLFVWLTVRRLRR